MRLFFALGPGDIVGDERRRREVSAETSGQFRRGETSLTFSHQLVNLIEARGHEAMLVSSHARADTLQLGGIGLINLPRAGEDAGGLGFYRSRISYGLQLAAMARDFGASLAIIDSGTTFPFVLNRFRQFGMAVAVNFHNVRWAQGFEPKSAIKRIERSLDSRFFRSGALAALGCSPACAEQARADGAGDLPYFGWTGQYSPAGFPEAPGGAPIAPGGPRITFAGRIERNKGVFDLIPIARGLRDAGLGATRIEVCGDGSALAQLRDAVAASDVADMIDIRGRLERTALLEAYARADLVIVPTRGDFTEGMPLVCAEAMLSYRPVLTSRVSNALPVLGDAVLEAVPEDVDSYVAAIRRFAGNAALRDRLTHATIAAREQFLDPSRSYAAAIDAVIDHAAGTQSPPLDYAAILER